LVVAEDLSLNGRLFVSGNVGIGIGTTAPAYTLDVSAASTAPFRVGVGSTNAIAVNSSGYVGIGTTNPICPLHVAGSLQVNGVSQLGGVYAGTYAGPWGTTGNWCTYGTYSGIVWFCGVPQSSGFGNAGTGGFVITPNAGGTTGANGGVYVNNGGSGWGSLSDFRYKKNIEQVENSLANLLQLNPIYYNYITTPDCSSNMCKNIGFIAQDVIKLFPMVVDENSGITHTESNGDTMGLMGLRMTDLIPYIVKGIQEQNVVVQELQSENTDLKARLTALETRLSVAGF
jgi:hypothetical protein